MSKKKIGVITFHNYDNYGAVLQSYALQRKLKALDTEPEIIDYRCEYIGNPFRLVNLKQKGLFGYMYNIIGHICYIPRRRKFNLFRRRIHYSEPATTGNMDAVSEKYDITIAGSDRIWDYKITNFDKTYFLDFVKSGKKCSYAASIGESLPPDNAVSEYSRLLKGFDKILIREEYGADIVEQLTGNRPQSVCDPTLLLNAGEWSQLIPEAKKQRNKEKYILVYQLGINRQLINFVKRLRDKTGYKIVYVPFPLVGLLKCKCKIAAGPVEWIDLIKNAEYVVSDSFHGILFALIFNRNFFVKTDGQHANRRVDELLKMTKLTERTIENVSYEALTDDIDFTYANEQIHKLRKHSLEQLKSLVQD